MQLNRYMKLSALVPISKTTLNYTTSLPNTEETQSTKVSFLNMFDAMLALQLLNSVFKNVINAFLKRSFKL